MITFNDVGNDSASLVNYIESSATFHRLIQAVSGSQARRWVRGEFEFARAAAAFKHIADDASLDFAVKGEAEHTGFASHVRLAVGQHYAHWFMRCIHRGTLDDLGSVAAGILRQAHNQ